MTRTWRGQATLWVWLALVLCQTLVTAHGGGGMKGMSNGKGSNNSMEDDDDDDDGDDDHGSTPLSPEEVEKKEFIMLLAHALIATFVVWVTMPIATALISGRKIETHRTLSSANTLGLLFAGLIAILGFAEGTSWHALIALVCLGAWVGQAGYGWVRHYLFRSSMPIKPHRSFGIILFVLTMLTWLSGVLHVMESCNAPSDVQMCNAHFFLGGIFIIVGLVDGYYAPEFAAKVEMCLMAFGGLSELVGEGVVDSILNAIDPATFRWDSMAKMVHLSAASVWILSALVGWLAAIKRPLTLERGIGLVVGCFFHLIFMFSHGEGAPDKTQAAHLVHELALVPVLITRLTARMPKVTSYLLTVSGFAFVMAADPVARDVGDSVSTFGYCALVVLFASIFHGVHGYIRKYILRKEPSETMLERTGFALPVYAVLACFGRFCCCCCPSLSSFSVEHGEVSKVKEGNKYQHLDTVAPALEEEAPLNGHSNGKKATGDMDEDVTSAPPV